MPTATSSEPAPTDDTSGGVLLTDLQAAIRGGRLAIVVGTGVSLGATADALASWKGLLDNGLTRIVQLGIKDASWAKTWRDVLARRDADAEDMIGAAEQVASRLGGPGDGRFSKWLR